MVPEHPAYDVGVLRLTCWALRSVRESCCCRAVGRWDGVDSGVGMDMDMDIGMPMGMDMAMEIGTHTCD